MNRRTFHAWNLSTILFLAGWLAPGTSAFGAVSDHYKCYASKQLAPVFQRENVTLADAFESTVETVMRPKQFCNPVDKEGEGIQDATAHLNCYRTRRAPGTPDFVPRIVEVDNQFGAQSLYLPGRADLCVPAEKDGVASTLDVNHYKCYRAQVPEGEPRFLNRFVFLQDQFEGKQTVVKRPRLFCNPADKNGEGILDSSLALACYQIRQERGQPRFTRLFFEVEDQFSDGQPVSTRANKITMLCLPSTVIPPTPTPTPTPTPIAPTPTSDFTPSPTPTPGYGSAIRAFLGRAGSLLE
jgi:hypothetical protein